MAISSNNDRIKRENARFMRLVVEALRDAGETDASAILSAARTEAEFDAACEQLSVSGGNAWTVVEQNTFLFKDWDGDDDSGEKSISEFESMYGDHPVAFAGAARCFWNVLGNVDGYWKVCFPEVFARFQSTDRRRIPWNVKPGLSQYKPNTLSWVPVPDYGAPLCAMTSHIKLPSGEELEIHVREGQLYKEAYELAKQDQRRNLLNLRLK